MEVSKDPLDCLIDYGGTIHEDSYSISIDTHDARTAISEYAKQVALAFADWIGQDENPFMGSSTKGKWLQACGNSTEWTTEKLYEMFLKENNLCLK